MKHPLTWWRAPFLLALLALNLVPFSARSSCGSIAVGNNSSFQNFSSVSTFSWAHAVTLSGGALVVSVVLDATTANNITAVTYGGQSFLPGPITTDSGNYDIELWYLLNAPVGAGNVTITASGLVTGISGSVNYFGVQGIGAVTNTAGTTSVEGDRKSVV